MKGQQDAHSRDSHFTCNGAQSEADGTPRVSATSQASDGLHDGEDAVLANRRYQNQLRQMSQIGAAP